MMHAEERACIMPALAVVCVPRLAERYAAARGSLWGYFTAWRFVAFPPGPARNGKVRC